MQRWHEADCTTPNVVTLADKIPQCQACHRRPQIDKLVARNASTSSVPLVPPDLPSGQMNLWWPRSVPYSASPLPPDPKGTLQQPSIPPAENEKDVVSVPPASPYATALKSDEFRLIFMEPAATPDSPVHLTLEVYNLDDCPEYETVSYTWAGENGDSALSQPIFVGPFWDVLLQTQNCWDMLRFMRPQRLPRMLWVDAICINQSDTLERSMQVANMRLIYSACSRVVVYLGPKISMPLHDRNPRRRRLHELEAGAIKPCSLDDGAELQTSQHSLRDILKLRYFSRIWVIQELLLSQRVVIRIGDVDFWADPAMAAHFSSKVPGWNWGSTAAAWVQFISQGTSSDRNLKELIRMSSDSRATDPRDRLFGLLGIMPELANENTNQEIEMDDDFLNIKEGELQADYSLSCQHVFIGLFAHCLLSLHQPNILYHASSLSRNMPNYPTWAPDWKSASTWKILFQAPRLTSEDVFEKIRDMVENGHSTEGGKMIPLKREHFDIYELKGPAREHVTKERHWRKGAYIDASTGGLNINLTQYMTISAPVERVGTVRGLDIFLMRSESFSVYLLSEHKLHEMLTGAGNEELFILNKDGYSFVYLLLACSMNKDGKKRYSLISTCPYVQILLSTRRSANEVPTIRALQLKDLQQSVYDLVKECIEILDSDNTESLIGWRNAGILAGIKTPRDLLPALKQLYTEQLGPHEDVSELGDLEDVSEGENLQYVNAFGKMYVQCIDGRFSPYFDGEYVTISVSTRWKECFDLYFFQYGWVERQMERIGRYTQEDEEDIWKFRFKDSEGAWEFPYISPSAYKKLTKSGVERWVEIQFPISWVRQALLTDGDSYIFTLFQNLDRISLSLGTSGEELWSLLSMDRDPDPDLRFVATPSHRLFFGMHTDIEDLCHQLGVKMSTFMVCIE